MRRSILFLLTGVPLAALAVAGSAAILLPQLAVSRLAERAEARSGLSMTVEGGSGISLSDGLAVTLDNVTFTRTSAQGVPTLVVAEIRIPSPLSLLMGGSLKRIELIDPVFTFIAADTKNLPETEDGNAPSGTAAKPIEISIENGAIKASDPQHNLALAVTDISGEIRRSDGGALEGNLRGLFNGVSSQLDLAIDDTRRLQQRGSPSDVTLTSKAGQIVMSGRLRLTGDLQFDGSLSAEASDAQSFLSWMGVPLSGLNDGLPLALDSGISIAQSKAGFRNFAFALGDMQAKGDFAIQAAAPRPSVEGTLSFNTINFNIYGSGGNAVQTTPPDLTKEWREQRLPFEDLKSVDGNISITTGSFTAGAVTAGPSTLKAQLNDGALQANLQTASLFGGKGAMDLALQQGETTRMKLALDVAGVAAKDFLAKAFGISFLEGPLSLKTDLTATGGSPAQLISTLAGNVTLSLTEGRIDGLDLAHVAGLVGSGDLDGWGIAPGTATGVAQVSASARVADGIATLTDTTLQSAGLSANITGDVDLLRRAVNLKVTPGEGLGLPVAAKVKGPWEKPKISAKLDVEGLLQGDGADAGNTAKSAKKILKKLLGD